jgi:peptidoglycan glycosyltransferase
MNAPIRRVSLVIAFLFSTLLVSTTLIQYVFVGELNSRPDNRRTLLATYARDRGDILVGGKAVARSDATDDQYKYVRVYDPGALYAHATGSYSFYGAFGGLEQAENELLSGSSDKLFYRRVSDLFTGRRPQGANLQTTLDPKVQEAAAKGLGDQVGAAIALDPKTGAILAMVSHPSYDPNAISGHDLTKVDENFKALNTDPSKPLLNRGINELYPPGSIFKVVTAAAALSSGKYTPDSQLPGPMTLPLPGTSVPMVNHDRQACGPGGTMTQALVVSCNTAFAYLGMQIGDNAIADQAAKFGFGDSINVPMRVTPSSFPPNLNKPQTAQSAIGQFDVLVTPMQMAMVAAGVANDGVVMTPYLVNKVIGPDLSVIDTAKPTELSRAVTPAVSRELTDMMVQVVQRGTGVRAQIPGVEVAGKTSTAEHGTGRRAHAWFISFAPAKDPQIAVAVIVEDGGTAGSEAGGGIVAAPIAKMMMQARLSE